MAKHEQAQGKWHLIVIYMHIGNRHLLGKASLLAGNDRSKYVFDILPFTW